MFKKTAKFIGYAWAFSVAGWGLVNLFNRMYLYLEATHKQPWQDMLVAFAIGFGLAMYLLTAIGYLSMLTKDRVFYSMKEYLLAVLVAGVPLGATLATINGLFYLASWTHQNYGAPLSVAAWALLVTFVSLVVAFVVDIIRK